MADSGVPLKSDVVSSGSRGDVVGRIVGILVFLVGVGLLLVVFYIAYDLFTTSPATALGIKLTGNAKTDTPPATIGVQFAWLLCRIGALAVMSIAGSLIANKGINLYCHSMQANLTNGK